MTRTIGYSIILIGTVILFIPPAAQTYPPAVGILAGNRSCLSCHLNNGPWTDEARTLIDILDAQTKTSLRQTDGRFLLEVGRGRPRTVLTVIGRPNGETSPPYRNAWLYVDPSQLKTPALSKFAPGWEVNLPMVCRIVGDSIAGYAGAHITVLPMTLRPVEEARDAGLELQVLLTAGESVKGKAREGLISNYLVRRVLLRVRD